MDKHALIRALCELVEQDIARATETAERTREDATHEEARPENDKDTRALEQTYLARGQAQRVVDLQKALKQIRFMDVIAFAPDDAVALSALVQLESSTEKRWYFLAPAAGGRRIKLGDVSVDVITPEAPLGRALAGRARDEEFTLRTAGRAVEWVIIEVR